jgi:hypothetical protein
VCIVSQCRFILKKMCFGKHQLGMVIDGAKSLVWSYDPAE